MTSSQLQRILNRIVFDLKDLAENRSVDSDSAKRLKDLAEVLEEVTIYTTDL